MKIKNLLLGVALLSSTIGFSQAVSLQAYGGYQFFGSASTSLGRLELEPGEAFGIGIDFGLNKDIGFNLIYTYQNSVLSLSPYGSPFKEDITEMHVNYIMGGSTYHYNSSSRVTPFGGILVGMAVFNPVQANRDDEIFFAFGGQLGARIALTDALGINFRTQMLAPVQGLGASLWCGPGGCDVGVSAVSGIFQMNVLAGVDIKLLDR